MTHYLFLVGLDARFFYFFPIFANLFIEVFSWNTIFLSPGAPKSYFNLFLIFLEFGIWSFIRFFKHKPCDYQFFIEILGRPQHLYTSAFVISVLVEIKYICNKATGYLPRVFPIQKCANIVVHVP